MSTTACNSTTPGTVTIPVAITPQIICSNHHPLVLIAGPCQIESRDHGMEMAAALVELSQAKGIPLVYKSSFDKANRMSSQSHRGLGLARGLQVLADIKAQYACPILTDIHETSQVAPVAEVADVLQIPALLSRQTDLVVAATVQALRLNRTINIKKGQFLAPQDMANIVAKATWAAAANKDAADLNHPISHETEPQPKITITERGTSFGYHNLVVDMRGLTLMKDLGHPVVFDATHSVQQPGIQGASSGGQRHLVETLARAAVAVGIAAIFIETHEDPDRAPSDGPCMVPLSRLGTLLDNLLALDKIAKTLPSIDMSYS